MKNSQKKKTKKKGKEMPSYLQYRKMMAVLDAEFKEEEHPRDDDGKFTNKNGGGSSSSSEPKRIDTFQIKQYNVISFRKDGRKYEVLGWRENGEAHLRDIRTGEKTDRKIGLNETVYKHLKGTTKYIDTEKMGEKKDDKKSVVSGGSVPKQYRKAYSDMMDRVHKSAKAEVTEDDAKKSAVELAKKLNKPYGEKEINQRIADFAEYRKKAKSVKNDLDKIVQVDSQMRHKKGGQFVDGEYKGGEYGKDRAELQYGIISTQEKKDENGKTILDKNGDPVYEGIDWEKKIPAKGEKPKLVILGGRGGSGKSSFTDGSLGDDGYDRDKFFVIDPDEYKTRLPEYKDKKGTKYYGVNAWEVHEESSDMKKAALDMARKKGANVVLDGTLSKYSSVKKVIDAFKEAGYDVEGAYMHLPREKSVARGILRGMKGRFVPVGQLLEMKENEDVFEQLMPEFRKWSIYDNDVPKGEKPKLVARSK